VYSVRRTRTTYTRYELSAVRDRLCTDASQKRYSEYIFLESRILYVVYSGVLAFKVKKIEIAIAEVSLQYYPYDPGPPGSRLTRQITPVSTLAKQSHFK